MADIGLFMEISGGDVHVASNDLVLDEGLETAVRLSLFCDKRATFDQLPADFPKNDLRGWWGDMRPEVEGDKIGSWLWLLGREKTTAEVLGKARNYARDALQWMIDDKVSSSIDITAAYIPDLYGWLYLYVGIHRPSGNAVDYRFDYQWSAQAAKRSE